MAPLSSPVQKAEGGMERQTTAANRGCGRHRCGDFVKNMPEQNRTDTNKWIQNIMAGGRGAPSLRTETNNDGNMWSKG